MPPPDEDRVPRWRRYLRFWRPNAAGDVRDELEFHLQSAVDELEIHGMPHDEARAAARARFGDVDGITRTLYTLSDQRERHMQRAEWWQTVKQDLVFGLRQLRKSPGFTTVAVLTLALGIGANSAIFSVVYSVLLRPLPYANSARIVTFSQHNDNGGMCCAPFGNYYTWRDQSRSFTALAATMGPGRTTLTGAGEPMPLPVLWASADYWRAEFIPPVIGRYFTAAEDRIDAPKVVVLSYALWQSRFNGDRAVLGRQITLDGQPYEVIGVAPSDYILAGPQERAWAPLAPPPTRLRDFGDHELHVVGLLRPGVTMAAAAAELTRIDSRLAQENPHNGYDGIVVGSSLADTVLGSSRLLLYTLLGAVALVLLIACGNIANLLVARATVRRGEIAIRGALGATRGRIVAQLLVESIILGLVGGGVGLAVGVAGLRFLVTSPASIPRLADASLNLPVLLFTLALSVACALIFGLAPALRAARLDLQQTLRDGGREASVSARSRLRQALIIGELCLASLLLVGAGLLIKTSLIMQAVPSGFDTHNLLAFSISLPGTKYKTGPQIEAGLEELEGRIAAIPGVKAVARSQVAPIYGGGWNWTAARPGSNGHDEGSTSADMRGINPGFFAALGTPLLRGREFTVADGPEAAPVAIISRGLAEHLYGKADPIGQLVSNNVTGKDPHWRQVVGVVEDIHESGPTQEPYPALYMPSAQWVNGGATYMVRGAVPVLTLVPSIRRAVASVDPSLPLAAISTMDKALANTTATTRFMTWLLTLLGLTGLVLAAVGVYGVIAYFVTQRTHEFGVRIALGASGGSVRWMVVREGLVIGALGVGAGLVVARLASRFVDSLMFGMTSHDPQTFATVGIVLVLVGAAASYIPARRATRVDPLTALRGS
ncbi:MAG TPA: ABC transporter permease [Gemmatimonadaceae bacterium]|nr:ABC transporter permease [Gemmatimonadaceae bacterium]